ncbi:MAG: M23 family metallopeptidase [Parvularculaceae bacterium]
MKRLVMIGLVAAFGCSASSEPGAAQGSDAAEPTEEAASEPAPADPDAANEALAKKAAYAEAMKEVEARQLVFAQSSEHVQLSGAMTQGGLVFGQTVPGARARLDGDDVMVGADGRFVVGFGRDSALSALLLVNLPDGGEERIALKIEDREFPVQRIDGLDQSKVSGFTEGQLKKIAADTEKKKAARVRTEAAAPGADAFSWPVKGRISGVFGSQRILNGEAKTPHSGLDVAAPQGTQVLAPADGIVRLAEPDMYFEGGLVLLDHGHWVESAFLHLSRLDVTPGQVVKKGDPIGAVGMTGRATGPHLHWSLKWSGRLVDPQLMVAADENPQEPAAPSSGGR